MIEIRIDGKTVKPLEAARALNVPGGPSVLVQTGRKDGPGIMVYPRYRTSKGALRLPWMSCPTFTADTVEKMREGAHVISTAADLVALAEMLAAEQDAASQAAEPEPALSPEVREYQTARTVPTALCLQPDAHADADWGPWGAAKTVLCDRPEHHEPPAAIGNPRELETTGIGVRLAVCGRHIAMDANGRCDACDETGPSLQNERLPWVMSEDDGLWRTVLPDGRSAVIEQLKEGDENGDGAEFVARVHESAEDFIESPPFPGLLAAGAWAVRTAEKGGA